MNESPVAVAVEGVSKRFDAGIVHALNGVNLTVNRGEWVALTGPSGSGKSTLLHMLAALDSPDDGTVRVFGHDVARLTDASAYRRCQVGLVFQLHNLLPQLSAARNVEIAMFATARSGTERHARAMQLLADVDLRGREHRTPTRLSGGERQRVAIARALANDPPLLLADEPTGSLDSASVAKVIGLIQRLRAGRPDMTIVMVTHDPAVASAADRVVTLRDGAVEAPTAAGDPVSPRS